MKLHALLATLVLASSGCQLTAVPDDENGGDGSDEPLAMALSRTTLVLRPGEAALVDVLLTGTGAGEAEVWAHSDLGAAAIVSVVENGRTVRVENRGILDRFGAVSVNAEVGEGGEGERVLQNLSVSLIESAGGGTGGEEGDGVLSLTTRRGGLPADVEHVVVETADGWQLATSLGSGMYLVPLDADLDTVRVSVTCAVNSAVYPGMDDVEQLVLVVAPEDQVLALDCGLLTDTGTHLISGTATGMDLGDSVRLHAGTRFTDGADVYTFFAPNGERDLLAYEYSTGLPESMIVTPIDSNTTTLDLDFDADGRPVTVRSGYVPQFTGSVELGMKLYTERGTVADVGALVTTSAYQFASVGFTSQLAYALDARATDGEAFARYLRVAFGAGFFEGPTPALIPQPALAPSVSPGPIFEFTDATDDRYLEIAPSVAIGAPKRLRVFAMTPIGTFDYADLTAGLATAPGWDPAWNLTGAVRWTAESVDPFSFEPWPEAFSGPTTSQVVVETLGWTGEATVE